MIVLIHTPTERTRWRLDCEQIIGDCEGWTDHFDKWRKKRYSDEQNENDHDTLTEMMKRMCDSWNRIMRCHDFRRHHFLLQKYPRSQANMMFVHYPRNLKCRILEISMKTQSIQSVR